ncbi:MAG TPA: RsmB/NOP family class I SAM-dependent RNA methyltransferase [Lacipirellulaceae bacterium]|jgi:16S rRNA (cytosine967-C5)-methyltransferase|nr:RsmB/NOP family class I SAM-dependent RNA methyltransferase [Lacipirellulaceae bacterium]
MTPSARLQAAIEILEHLQKSAQPADGLLRDWARRHRFAGSKDRAAIAERVYAVLRHSFSFAWRMQSDDPRSAVIASLLMENASAEQIESLFDGSRFGPSALNDRERNQIAVALPAGMPRSSEGEFPEFLDAELERAFGLNLLTEMKALTGRAPVDLRVNTLTAQRDEVLSALLAEGYTAERTSFSPYGIRIPSSMGLSSLGRHPLFESGAFEFQDEASQIAALLACARPGEQLLDLAAGAGGKSLALASEMNNLGKIVACDIDGRRLAALQPRAHRAGVSIVDTCLLKGEPPDGPFDLVFVDAPCSGTGIWRRQPELRSRLTASRLADLMSIQDRLLDQASTRVAIGGRLLYATCSVLPCENEDRLSAFLMRHPGFRTSNAGAIWRERTPEVDLPLPDDFFRASPYVTGTDGFFAAVLRLETAS